MEKTDNHSAVSVHRHNYRGHIVTQMGHIVTQIGHIVMVTTEHVILEELWENPKRLQARSEGGPRGAWPPARQNSENFVKMTFFS